MTATRRRLVWLGCTLAFVGLAGCGGGGPKTYPVRGKVVYKGTGEAALKLANGYVILEAASDPGQVVQGQIDEEGTFALGSVIDGQSVGGVRPGEYRVRVVPPADEDTGKLVRRVLDPRFLSFDKSGIRLTVTAGTNDVTIEVEPPKR
jgi:hypothetical protein